METKKIALIVAGGKGIRMGSDIPKQFIEIAGKPILMHTLEAFYSYNPNIEIILVLPASQQKYWNDLCKKYQFSIIHKIASGGDTRFHSVKNGLKLIHSPALIAIHDGVRPLVSHDTLERCFSGASTHSTAVPVIDAVDSLRQVSGNSSLAVDRNAFKLVQTPQVFESDLLLKAYKQDYSLAFTDDASVVEQLGININLVEGNRENFKITTSYDLELATLFLSKKL